MSDREARRVLLRAIAYESADPEIRPADRLRAIELLAALGDEDPAEPWREELAELTVGELDLTLDSLLGREIVRSAIAGEGRWPELEAALRDAIEERARELSDRDAIDVEIERRSAALAERLYVDRGVREAERAANERRQDGSAGFAP